MKSTMTIIRVGVDIAKSVFHIHAVDREGKPVWQRKLKRYQWVDALCQLAPQGAIIGMEACASSHYWYAFGYEKQTWLPS